MVQAEPASAAPLPPGAAAFAGEVCLFDPIWVSTPELREQAAGLSAIAARLEQLAGWHEHLLQQAQTERAEALQWAFSAGAAMVSAAQARHALERLRPLGPRLSTLAWQLRLLGQLLLAGLLEYEGAEASIRALFDPAEADRVRSAAQRFGVLLLSPVASLWNLGSTARGLGGPLLETQGVSDPEFVMLVRRMVSLSDEALLGLLGAPAELDALRGDDGLELVGLVAVAASLRPALTVLSGGRFGRLQPVQLRQAGGAAAAAPQAVAELVRRIPNDAPGGAQLRIDRYAAAGGGHSWVVYLGGTVLDGPDQAAQPFSMTSNLRLIAQERSASLEAVQLAMRRAGVGADDPVVLVGYSQGGLIAAGLAQRGGHDYQALVTVGAPIGHLQLDAALPVLAVEHRDDLVPALSGVPADHSGADRTVVSRRAIMAGAAPEGGLPAHALDRYLETVVGYENAGGQDPAASVLPPGIRHALERLQGTGSARWYLAEHPR